MAETVFRRSGLYKDTYLDKIQPNPKLRNKFRDFMEIKRNNPNAPFGGRDIAFASTGNFTKAIPGIKHAHITGDISIVYKVTGNQIFLYGFFTHDEIGIGQPANINKQKSAALKFNNQQFA